MDQKTRQFIHEMANVCNRNSDEWLIVLIGNIQKETQSYCDYDSTSVMSEYYSYNQYQEISSSIREIGFDSVSYLDEVEFIRDYICERLKNNAPKKLLVVNSAQKGISPGRKSLIPAFCDLHNITYAGSDAYTVSFSRDKYHWNCMLRNGGLPVCPSFLYDAEIDGWLFGSKPPIGKKVIAKLNRESSSIGLNIDSIFEYDHQKDDYLHSLSQSYKQQVIVQSFISGFELEVPALSFENQVYALEPAGIQVDGKQLLDDMILDYNIRGNHLFDFYDYTKWNPSVASQVLDTTRQVVSAMRLQGVCRVDYRVNLENKFFITDISSNPHITKSMTFWYLYEKSGFRYSDVLRTIIGMAIQKQENQYG